MKNYWDTNFKKIHEEILISEPKNIIKGKEVPYVIHFDEILNLFICFKNGSDFPEAPAVLVYEMDKPITQFTFDEIYRVLKYCVGEPTNEVMTATDVFIQDEFTTLLAYTNDGEVIFTPEFESNPDMRVQKLAFDAMIYKGEKSYDYRCTSY